MIMNMSVPDILTYFCLTSSVILLQIPNAYFQNFYLNRIVMIICLEKKMIVIKQIPVTAVILLQFV